MSVTSTHTEHILDLLNEATEMARVVNGTGDPTIAWNGTEYTKEQFLARASNIASQAGQELMTESFMVAGFPAV